jgi:hypothetical protein
MRMRSRGLSWPPAGASARSSMALANWQRAPETPEELYTQCRLAGSAFWHEMTSEQRFPWGEAFAVIARREEDSRRVHAMLREAHQAAQALAAKLHASV